MKNIIADWIDAHSAELTEASDYIWAHPELAYKEYISSKYLAEYLEKNGFEITENLDEVECIVMGFDTELTFKKLEDVSKL